MYYLCSTQHIDYIATKLSQVAGIIFKVRNHISLKSRTMIYNCLAGSYLTYGIVTWGAAAPTSLQKLRILQNKIIRYITFSPPRTNIDSKYKSLNILTTSELYFLEVSKFVHSISKGESPAVFTNFLPLSSHLYETRSKTNNNFCLAQPRTERGKRSLCYKGVLFWSQIPADLKVLSLKSFKALLKRFLIENGIP